MVLWLCTPLWIWLLSLWVGALLVQSSWYFPRLCVGNCLIDRFLVQRRKGGPGALFSFCRRHRCACSTCDCFWHVPKAPKVQDWPWFNPEFNRSKHVCVCVCACQSWKAISPGKFWGTKQAGYLGQQNHRSSHRKWAPALLQPKTEPVRSMGFISCISFSTSSRQTKDFLSRMSKGKPEARNESPGNQEFAKWNCLQQQSRSGAFTFFWICLSTVVENRPHKTAMHPDMQANVCTCFDLSLICKLPKSQACSLKPTFFQKPGFREDFVGTQHSQSSKCPALKSAAIWSFVGACLPGSHVGVVVLQINELPNMTLSFCTITMFPNLWASINFRVRRRF